MTVPNIPQHHHAAVLRLAADMTATNQISFSKDHSTMLNTGNLLRSALIGFSASLVILSGLISPAFAQSQTPISALPAATVPLGQESVPVVQSGATKRAPANAFGIPVQQTTAPTPIAQYQQWWNTATVPPTLEVYDGAQWVATGTLDSTGHAWNAQQNVTSAPGTPSMAPVPIPDVAGRMLGPADYSMVPNSSSFAAFNLTQLNKAISDINAGLISGFDFKGLGIYDICGSPNALLANSYWLGKTHTSGFVVPSSCANSTTFFTVGDDTHHPLFIAEGLSLSTQNTIAANTPQFLLNSVTDAFIEKIYTVNGGTFVKYGNQTTSQEPSRVVIEDITGNLNQSGADNCSLLDWEGGTNVTLEHISLNQAVIPIPLPIARQYARRLNRSVAHR